MNKINLKKPLTVFGKPVADKIGVVMINESLANVLIQGKSDNPMKMMTLCTKLYEQGEIELDDEGVEWLIKNIKASQIASDMLIGTVLSEIKKQTDEG